MVKRTEILEAFLADCAILVQLRKERNLSRVAESLGISRQRLQARLERLEQYFGKPLYHDQFKLTDLGRLLVAVGLAAERLGELYHRQIVKLGCTLGIHQFIVEQLVLDFETRVSPHTSVIRFGGEQAELLEMVQQGEVDLAILYVDQPFDGIIARPLWSVETFVVIPRQFGTLVKKPDRLIRYKDFEGLPLILGAKKESVIYRAFQEHEVPVSPETAVIQTQLYSARVEFANQGKGIAFIPAHFLFKGQTLRGVETDRVAVKNVGHLFPQRVYSLCLAIDRSSSEADERFINFLRRWSPPIPGVKLLTIPHRIDSQLK